MPPVRAFAGGLPLDAPPPLPTIPGPIPAAGWSLRPYMVPSALAVRPTVGADVCGAGWVSAALRNGPGLMFCETAPPPAYGVLARRPEPPFASGCSDWGCAAFASPLAPSAPAASLGRLGMLPSDAVARSLSLPEHPNNVEMRTKAANSAIFFKIALLKRFETPASNGCNGARS